MWEKFRRNPVLYPVGGLLTAVACLAVFLALGMPLGLSPNAIGVGAAGVVIATFDRGAIGFTRWAEGLGPKLRLDSPIRRGVFLLVPVGFALLVVSWLVFPGSSLGYWAEHVFVSPSQLSYYEGNTRSYAMCAWAGFAFIWLGGVCSFFYTQTLGRLLGWVMGR